MVKEKCEKCDGDGVILSFNTEREHLEIQRCDDCKGFESDLDAWNFVKPLTTKESEADILNEIEKRALKGKANDRELRLLVEAYTQHNIKIPKKIMGQVLGGFL